MKNPMHLLSKKVLLAGSLAIILNANIKAEEQDCRLKNLKYSGVTAINVSADPKTVEVHLRAEVGPWNFGGTLKDTQNCYLYVDENQSAPPSFPGPLIVANKGDTLIVRLKNNLPVATTIHWHGIQTYANQDGSHISQEPIQPGECFTYKIKVDNAKFTWYHAHVDTKSQIPRGLHGGLLIRDQERENKIFNQNGKPLKEVVMIMSDVLLDNNDQFAPFIPVEPNLRAQTIFNGRGNQPLLPETFDYLLINGKIEPRHCLKKNKAQRWRMVNVANSTFMRFAFNTDEAQMWQVGGDAGLLEGPIKVTVPKKHPLPLFGIESPVYGFDVHTTNPSETEGILLTPAERADVIVAASKCSSDIKLTWFDTWRGRHIVTPDLVLEDDPNDGLYNPATLLNLGIKKSEKSYGKEYIPPQYISSVERYDVIDQEPKTMLFNFGHGTIPQDGAVKFFATTKIKNPTLPPPLAGPVPFGTLTSAYAIGNPVNNVSVNPQDVLFIQVQNFTRGWHNYHQHGFDFQLIQYEFFQPDGEGGVKRTVVPAQYLESKDTTLVPGRPTDEPGSKTVAIFKTLISDIGRESRIMAYPELGLNDDTTPIVQQPVHRNPMDQIHSIGCSQYDYRSNGWLAHCHILEHADAGMMSVIMVSDES